MLQSIMVDSVEQEADQKTVSVRSGFYVPAVILAGVVLFIAALVGGLAFSIEKTFGENINYYGCDTHR
jgi:hypothetical protein